MAPGLRTPESVSTPLSSNRHSHDLQEIRATIKDKAILERCALQGGRALRHAQKGPNAMRNQNDVAPVEPAQNTLKYEIDLSRGCRACRSAGSCARRSRRPAAPACSMRPTARRRGPRSTRSGLQSTAHRARGRRPQAPRAASRARSARASSGLAPSLASSLVVCCPSFCLPGLLSCHGSVHAVAVISDALPSVMSCLKMCRLQVSNRLGWCHQAQPKVL